MEATWFTVHLATSWSTIHCVSIGNSPKFFAGCDLWMQNFNLYENWRLLHHFQGWAIFCYHQKRVQGTQIIINVHVLKNHILRCKKMLYNINWKHSLDIVHLILYNPIITPQSFQFITTGLVVAISGQHSFICVT